MSTTDVQSVSKSLLVNVVVHMCGRICTHKMVKCFMEEDDTTTNKLEAKRGQLPPIATGMLAAGSPRAQGQHKFVFAPHDEWSYH